MGPAQAAGPEVSVGARLCGASKLAILGRRVCSALRVAFDWTCFSQLASAHRICQPLTLDARLGEIFVVENFTPPRLSPWAFLHKSGAEVSDVAIKHLHH